jgi:3-hydroxyisobutyrate dehydrogenase-like beta-hydroxyacid dehydrogenase
MSKPLATVGIISIGDMGMGVAKLLLASGYRVITTLSGRRYVTKPGALGFEGFNTE